MAGLSPAWAPGCGVGAFEDYVSIFENLTDVAAL
jgi:hypothetical protein